MTGAELRVDVAALEADERDLRRQLAPDDAERLRSRLDEIARRVERLRGLAERAEVGGTGE